MPRTKTKSKPKAPAKSKKGCREEGCKEPGTLKGYCRRHYISHWKHIKFEKQRKGQAQLNSYINRMAEKYPEEYMSHLKAGLENEDAFKQQIQELGLEIESEAGDTDREFLEKLERKIK